ncbi:uncharacterized protein LOC129581138 [Paramacrobiotus metropolitanus]|uniref:uncharacterized protein LOC129581138 n=1 Tax=Paramacrobiotus metropolitanus TaxID=2943436 RepID=UPI002445C6C6|nr:uncharacterized protein LOC129581138 [Paramacrobiotus metropolitanus]
MLFFFLLTLSIFAVSQVTFGIPTQPTTEDEIFGFLSDLDTEDLLYTCNFLKSHHYVCNVTQLGASFLKGKSNPKETKKTPDRPGKFAIFNVTGEWADSDGFIKQFYVQLDNLDIIAKCFFRLSYYECFGVPKCDGSSGFSPCSGGEPWRGSYSGAPNIGFRGNVTAQAMQSPGAAKPQSLPSTDNADANYNQQRPETDSDSAFNASTTDDQMVVKHFSSHDNKTGMSSEGTIAMSPDGRTVIIASSGMVNNTSPDGNYRIGGFASSSSSFSSSFEDSNINSTENAETAPKNRRRPILDLFPSLFQSTSLGNLFGPLSVPSPKTDQQPKVTSATGAVPARGPHKCGENTSSTYDFSSLRCMIDTFQRNVMGNIMSSIQTAFSRMNFGNFGIPQPSASLFSQNAQPAMAQSRSYLDRPRAAVPYGVHVSVKSDASSQSNPFFPAINEDDDDTDSWPSFF